MCRTSQEVLRPSAILVGVQIKACVRHPQRNSEELNPYAILGVFLIKECVRHWSQSAKPQEMWTDSASQSRPSPDQF